MKGLTSEQAEERKRSGLQNLPVEAPSKSAGQIVAGNIFTFFNLIFAVLAACLLATCIPLRRISKMSVVDSIEAVE